MQSVGTIHWDNDKGCFLEDVCKPSAASAKSGGHPTQIYESINGRQQGTIGYAHE